MYVPKLQHMPVPGLSCMLGTCVSVSIIYYCRPRRFHAPRCEHQPVCIFFLDSSASQRFYWILLDQLRVHN